MGILQGHIRTVRLIPTIPASYSGDPEFEPWQVLLCYFKASHDHILAAGHVT
jgi:hypothetical protein